MKAQQMGALQGMGFDLPERKPRRLVSVLMMRCSSERL